jgi:porphobilinogen synthase
VKAFILFPKVPDSLKTNYAEEAYNPNGIVPRALSMIKSKFPDVIVATDIALDPYSSYVRKITYEFIKIIII